MGTYLSTPVLEKHTEEGSDLTDRSTPIRWAVVDMQGWRKSMEDAHVARTDVEPPTCHEGGSGETDAGNDAGHAKVFAVFDGHGGAEVARFCQIHLVPVLTSQSHWRTATAVEAKNGENKNVAISVGQALIQSFHALDELIDDPTSRGEIDRWRSERPPPYVLGMNEDKDISSEEKPGISLGGKPRNEESRPAVDLETGADVEAGVDDKVGDPQQRRHTALDPSEISDVAAKLVGHLLDENNDEDESEDNEEKVNNEDESAGKGETNGMSNTPNESSMLGPDNDDIEGVSKLTQDAEDLENKDSDGTVIDDSDDEKEEHSTENNDNDDGEVEKVLEKEQGTMVISANDAVALFQKLLHMNGAPHADDGINDAVEGDIGDVEVYHEEVMNGADGANNMKGPGGGDEEAEVAVPTKVQLLNPPTGMVAPSAAVPTRIQNGRKICNLPDHPVHAGCTSVVAVIVGRTLVVANAGDSRAVICRAGGLMEPLSFDHKPLQDREMNRITNAGGFVNQFGRVNGNLNLSRSIGDLKYKQVPGIPPAEQIITAEPDILSTTLRERDEFIILGCDGIWDCLSNEECVKYIRDRIGSKPPHEIGAELLDEIVSADPRASQGIGGDNMTIMIVDLLPQSRPYSSDC